MLSSEELVFPITAVIEQLQKDLDAAKDDVEYTTSGRIRRFITPSPRKCQAA
jgi:hypothetical protein